MSEAATYAPQGHNRTLAERFEELNADIPGYLSAQYGEMDENAQLLRIQFDTTAPDAIADDDTEKLMTDLGARINTFLQLCEGQRKVNKELPLKAPKLIDEFFKGLSGTLAVNLETLRSRVNVYKNQKMAEERRRQAEAARAAVEARERAERERREAERARQEAEAARIRECEAAAAEGRRAEATPEELAAQEAERIADEEAKRAAEIVVPVAKVTAPMVKAESGAKSGQVGKWVAKVDDRAALMTSLGPLGPYLTIAAIETAANACARHLKAAAVCPGLSFTEEFTTTFRS